MIRILLSITFLLGLSSIAQAKPRSTQADTVLDACKWAAEVQILKVTPSPGKGWLPSIEVRISKADSEIYFGQKPGAKVTVHPLDSSHDGTLKDLGNLVGAKTMLLMVVNQDDRVEFVGKRLGQKQRAYVLRSWYDYNAWWIYAVDKGFGTVIGKDLKQTLQLSAASIRKRLAKR